MIFLGEEVTVHKVNKKEYLTNVFLHRHDFAGVFLPDLCEVQRTNPHRAMIELLSSGAAAGPTPSSSLDVTAASPAPSPM